MNLRDFLPKKRHQLDESPKIKEYSEVEVANLIKQRDAAELRLRIARLTPMERLKLEHILKEKRRHAKKTHN